MKCPYCHQKIPEEEFALRSISENEINGRDLKKEAIEVLAFLNDKTGKNYWILDKNGKISASLELIIARLKSGATVQQCKMVIARKHREWSKDDKMWAYLRPVTLFRKTNFEQYLGECVTADKEKRGDKWNVQDVNQR